MVKMKFQPTVEQVDLFEHIQEPELRNRNRATFMANMYEDHTPYKSSTINEFGAARILKYFSMIPKEDQQSVLNNYNKIMSERGYKAVA